MENSELLYSEIAKHLLEDNKPSVYLNEIYDSPLFLKYPFKLLYDLRKAEQSLKHHPEGNVWNHTLLVVDEASKRKGKSKNEVVFMWSALLHDIGKPSTTKSRKGKITSYDHDKAGAKLAREFLCCFTEDENFINDVCQLVYYHMHILFVVNRLPFGDIEGMKRNTDVSEVALLGLCDRLGRGKVNKTDEEKNIEIFLKLMKRQ